MLPQKRSYTGSSRTTLWRKRIKGDDDSTAQGKCSCNFHQEQSIQTDNENVKEKGPASDMCHLHSKDICSADFVQSVLVTQEDEDGSSAASIETYEKDSDDHLLSQENEADCFVNEETLRSPGTIEFKDDESKLHCNEGMSQVTTKADDKEVAIQEDNVLMSQGLPPYAEVTCSPCLSVGDCSNSLSEQEDFQRSQDFDESQSISKMPELTHSTFSDDDDGSCQLENSSFTSEILSVRNASDHEDSDQDLKRNQAHFIEPDVHIEDKTQNPDNMDGNDYNPDPPYDSSDQSSSDEETDSDNEDSDIDLSSYQAYFLDQNPNSEEEDEDDPPENHENPHHDPEPPDDPSDDSNDDASSDEEELNDIEDLPHMENDELELPLVLQNNLSKGDVILMELGKAIRHNLTFECILDSFRNMNQLYGRKFFPISKNKLWSVIGLHNAGIQAHVYCGRKICGRYIGIKNEDLGEFVECECGYGCPTKKAKFFVTLNFRNQLKRFLKLLGIWNELQYRNFRVKQSPTSIEDICDGSHYQSLRQDGGPLASDFNFSYTFNLDGCRIFKKGKLKMWPLYARLNELRPELRQKFHFLVAVFIDTKDPNFKAFMKPFVEQANHLSTHGIRWTPYGNNEVRSLFIPLCLSCDSEARYGILNMVRHNSHNGCTDCNHEGVYAAGSMRYPVLDDNAQPQERTHATIEADLIEAQETGIEVRGCKPGMGQAVLLQHFDLREGQAADDLHADHEGCACDITDLLLTLAPRVDEEMPNVHLLQSIDEILLSIKTPSRISRKPASITSRGSYKGTEWRNWLYYFSIPCLEGLIAPEYIELISLLSHACFLLAQDVVEPHEVNEAERLLRRYALSFQEKFGLERMKYNLHLTTVHKVNSFRKLGPAWGTSTYPFESLNAKYTKLVTSPHGAILQVVKRYLLHQKVNTAIHDERVPAGVRERLREIIDKVQLKNVYEVEPHVYAVGRANVRVPSPEEAAVFVREGLNVEEMEEYSSILKGSTRYKSVHAQNEDCRSDDTFIYTSEDTFCSIQSIVVFRDNGRERCGLFVLEHDVARVHPVCRHLSVLRDGDADLLHLISVERIRSPAVRVNVRGLVYAAPMPNCFEID